MDTTRPSGIQKRHIAWIAIEIAMVYWALSLVTRFTGQFHFRVCFEGLTAGLLVWLCFWLWIAKPTIQYLLMSLIGIAGVVLTTQFVLSDSFSAWFETSIWYLPVVSIVAATLRIIGLRFDDIANSAGRQTFSIRSMLIGTAIIALSFPAIAGLAQFRSDNGARTMMWLIDALVWVVPTSLVCIGIIVAYLSNKTVYAICLLFSSPLIGIAICKVYRWNHYQSVVGVISTASILATVICWQIRRAGLGLVRSPKA